MAPITLRPTTPAAFDRAQLRSFAGGHARRVGRTAVRIAGRMDLDPGYIQLLREAAPLHDIGKLTLPRGLTNKAGPLSERERALMETHTRAGARILGGSKDPMLQMAATIAAAHHERWDGGGYPEGLAGWEIPLCARIVSVADVFDALTHERPYKPAWQLERAVATIARCAGTQFDPDVVEAFLDGPGRLGAGVAGSAE
jgi:putative two-component system response regulator